MSENNIVVESKAKISGQFHILVKSPDGSTREYEFDNLITNNGLNKIGRNVLPTRLLAGSGNTAPTFTDTQMQALLASSTVKSDAGAWTVVSTVETATNPHYITWSYAFVFPKNTAVGIWAELGSGWGTTDLFSRALIKDAEGNPITLTVVTDEEVTVTYSVRAYLPYIASSTTVNTITMNGTEYTLTSRPCLAQTTSLLGQSIFGTFSTGSVNTILRSYTNVTGMGSAINAPLAGTLLSSANASNTVSAYVTDSFYNQWTNSVPINLMNHSSISGFISAAWNYGICEVATRVEPPITKTNTQTFSITTRYYWDRY